MKRSGWRVEKESVKKIEKRGRKKKGDEEGKKVVNERWLVSLRGCIGGLNDRMCAGNTCEAFRAAK